MLRFDSTKRPARNYFSRREQWRLLVLVISLGVVILVMREVRKPENVARVTEAFAEPASARGEAGTPAVVEPPARPLDSFQNIAVSKSASAEGKEEQSTFAAADLRKVLALAGWTPERFGRFSDNASVTDTELEESLQLLWRVRSFDAASMEAWAKDGPSIEELRASPAECRGRMVSLAGHLVAMERHELAPEEAARFEMQAYYSCELELQNNGGRALVFTFDIPDAWNQFEPRGEPVTVKGLFVKQLPAKGETSSDDELIPLIVVKRTAWHPTAARQPVVSFGESVLGTLGMDVGLLDDVRSHGPIRSQEREAFYQALDAVGGIGANQLARFARTNLDQFAGQWESELSSGQERPRLLAREVVERAKQGRYSVAPLFNDTKRQIGQLVVVDGAARRVIRIDVSSRTDDGRPSDIARRFGFGHYYEIEVFTDDSQNYPLVFCVRELPEGFPTGEGLHVPIRIAGFFFKAWQYTTRGTRDSSSGDIVAGVGRPQFAPLLVGRAPLILKVEQAESGAGRLVGGGLFLLALGGIWAAAWWFARSDRKFAEKTPAAGFSLPPGESLNDLNLAAATEPIEISGANEEFEMRMRDEG